MLAWGRCKSEDVMVCSVCGSRAFNATEYRSGRDAAQRAPAFECRGCGAISLGEEAAASEEERDSVRVAIALRAEIADGANGPDRRPDPRRASTSTARVKVR
jgi:hypothetical protein